MYLFFSFLANLLVLAFKVIPYVNIYSRSMVIIWKCQNAYFCCYKAKFINTWLELIYQVN